MTKSMAKRWFVEPERGLLILNQETLGEGSVIAAVVENDESKANAALIAAAPALLEACKEAIDRLHKLGGETQMLMCVVARAEGLV